MVSMQPNDSSLAHSLNTISFPKGKSQKPCYCLDYDYPPNPEMSDDHHSTRKNVSELEPQSSSTGMK